MSKIENLAKDILVALLSNPKRYEYISNKVENKEITNEEANLKNINKAFKNCEVFFILFKNPKKTSHKKK